MAELADVWLSTYFGNNVGEDDYYEMQSHINPEKFPDWSALRSQEWFLRAQELAQAKRFFHWELEFPEAFQGESRGFDAVMGNPPYDILIRSEQGPDVINYLNTKYFAAEYNPNLFAMFTELSVGLVKEKGLASLIVPSMWLTNNKYTNMRMLLIGRTQLKAILDLQFTVFKEIIPTSIFIAAKIVPEDNELIKIGINKKERGKLPGGYLEITQSRLKSKVNDGFRDFISDDPNLLKSNIISDLGE
jgi:type I restriction-modification system DNA methylase subunit